MADQMLMDFNDRRAPMLTDEERRVWFFVSARSGRNAAILGTQIAELARVDYDTVRAIVSHLVNEHGFLIASCSRGYYVPSTPEEILEATKSLRHRGIMILQRAARLQKSSLEDVFGQAKIELEKTA